MGVAKEVDARYGRRAERERPLGVDLAHARGGEVDKVGDGERTALLSEADQLQQDLRGRLSVGERAVMVLTVDDPVPDALLETIQTEIEADFV